jgi:nucleotide-binding universal stress UspA family protein
MSTARASQPSTTPRCIPPLLREQAMALVSTARVRTLVVLDAPELASDTLGHVGSLIRLCGGGVTLLRVLEPPTWIGALDDPLTETALRAEAQRYLRDAVQQLDLGQVEASTTVSMGMMRQDAIAKTARDCAADVVVLVDSRHT